MSAVETLIALTILIVLMAGINAILVTRAKLNLYHNDEPIDSSTLNYTCTIRYNKKNDSFSFYFSVPWDEPSGLTPENKLVVMDPGVKTPLTCLSEDFYFDQGVEAKEKIKELIL